jgi:hypothetical protein
MGSALRPWVTAFILALGLFLLILIGRGLYNAFGLSDALFVSGAVLIGISALRVIYRTGVYDVSGYGLNKFMKSFRRDQKRTYQNIYDYKDQQLAKRQKRPFYALPYFVIGSTLLAIAYLFSSIALMA